VREFKDDHTQWQGLQIGYEELITDPNSIDENTYCLTDSQVKALLAVIDPYRYVTRWFHEGEPDAPSLVQFVNDTQRRLLMPCCNDDVLFRYDEDGNLESSNDGGIVWTPDPRGDIRVYPKVTFPPVTGGLGPDPKCTAADGMVKLLKEQIGDQLTDDMSRYTLSQLIRDWTTTIIGTSNPFEALVTVIANQIFSLVIATLRSAITSGTYDALRCVFYCNMEADGTFTAGEWSTVRSQTLSDISGIAGVFFEHLEYLLGPGGLTNLARSDAGAVDADCSACCPDCSSSWDVLDGSHGIIVARGTGTIDVQAQVIGGNYYMIISTNDPALCCLISEVEVLSGVTPALTGWTDCGTTPTFGVPQHTGLFGYGSYCIDYFQLQDAGAFTVRIHFADC